MIIISETTDVTPQYVKGSIKLLLYLYYIHGSWLSRSPAL